MFYIEKDSQVLNFLNINHGTIQGSILGPIIYAIYVSALFDITNLSNFFDDSYALTWNKNKESTITLMEEMFLTIIDWLSGSGLKVNETKTELCLFYHKNTLPIKIPIKILQSNDAM